MEISEDDGEDTQVDTNREYYVCSKYGEHDGLDNDEPHLEENLAPEDQGYPNCVIDELYNQLEVKKNDYEFESIVDN